MKNKVGTRCEEVGDFVGEVVLLGEVVEQLLHLVGVHVLGYLLLHRQSLLHRPHGGHVCRGVLELPDVMFKIR